MKDIKGNTLKIGDYVVFVHGKNSTASLKTGTITKIYQGRFQEECSCFDYRLEREDETTDPASFIQSGA